jgi:hypothetical protein
MVVKTFRHYSDCTIKSEDGQRNLKASIKSVKGKYRIRAISEK